MGHRKLMRVPMAFEWPIGKVWYGYQNPYCPMECPYCNGTGHNPGTKQISDNFYDFAKAGTQWCDNITQDEVQALVDAGRLWDFTRVPITEEQAETVRQRRASGHNCWLPENNGYVPSAAEVNEWSKGGIGHDAINRMILVEARAKRRGVWGHCAKCGGSGELFRDDNHREQYEAWENFDPPTGDGYQLWGTTSEGDPMSPVFASAEDLANWCAENTSIFGWEKTSRENWLAMFLTPDGCEIGSMCIGSAAHVGAEINQRKGTTP